MKKGNWGSLIFIIIFLIAFGSILFSSFAEMDLGVMILPFVLAFIFIIFAVVRSIIARAKFNKGEHIDNKEVFSEPIDGSEDEETDDVVDKFRREANFKSGAIVTKKYSYMNPKSYRMSFYVKYLDSSTNAENTESVSKDIYDFLRKGMSIPVKNGITGVKIDKKKIKNYYNE